MNRTNYIWGAVILMGVSALNLGFRAPARGPMAPTSRLENKRHATVRISETYGKLPLSFEANQGQTDSRVKFLSRRSGYTLFLTSNEAVLALRRRSAIRTDSVLANGQLPTMRDRNQLRRTLLPAPKLLASDVEPPDSDPVSQAPAVLRMKLVGANPNPKVEGLEMLPGKSNYFIGNDPKKWHTNVPNYAKVKCKDVYPGIDLAYYGNDGRLEYDFVISPGVDPRAIILAVDGAVAPVSPPADNAAVGTPPLQIDPSRDLLISTDAGEVRVHKPVVYQPVARPSRRHAGETPSLQLTNSKSQIQNRKSVDGGFLLLDANRVGFEVSNYDRSLPLIIDPVLSYSTYLGGSGGDFGRALALDSSGDVYVAGSTESPDFPALNAYDSDFGGGMCGDSPCTDAFVTKLASSGTELVYSTFLGGAGGDGALGLAVDAAGSAVVTGHTGSSDFPTTEGALQLAKAGPSCDLSREGCGDVFVTKLNSAGDHLVCSTYLGGSEDDGGHRIAVDSSGSAYLFGTTSSPDFPTVNPLQAQYGGQIDVFIAKLNATGSNLIYATYIGGTQWDAGYPGDIVVDVTGNVYVGGWTTSADFPTTPGAFQTEFAGAGLYDLIGDAFVLKLNPSGSALIYSTYLGGSGADPGDTLAVDSSGNAYIGGWTSSIDFPTTPGSVAPAHAGGVGCPDENAIQCWDGFLAKLNATGSALVYSTHLGGTDMDQVDGVVADSVGNAYVSGISSSLDLPTRNAFQSTNAGLSDGFVMMLDARGTLVYFTYIGGSDHDDTFALAVDTWGSLYVTGSTCSADLPTTQEPFQPIYAGGCVGNSPEDQGDAFVVKISRGFGVEVQPPIEPDATSIFDSRRGVVPVRFALMADGECTCDLYPATIALFRVGDAAPVPVNESEFLMPSDDGLNFRVAGCQYEYNLGTRSLALGQYMVEIWMGNMKVGEAEFGLR